MGRAFGKAVAAANERRAATLILIDDSKRGKGGGGSSPFPPFATVSVEFHGQHFAELSVKNGGNLIDENGKFTYFFPLAWI